MANQSTGPIKEQPPSPSNLTVENVTKLELEYESIDGERCKVEEYIRRNQLLAELQTIQLVTTEVQEQVLLKSTTSTDLWRHGDRNEEKTELSSKPCGNETPLKLEKMQTTNVTELTSKHAETQTECDEQYTANTSKNDGHPEPDDTETKISTSKAVEQGSVPCVNTVGIETTSLEHDDSETFGQLPLGDEDNLLDEVEYVYSICEFCHLPKKPFPSIGQLASEPSSMLFCCAKIQELFQYMIMDTIESYTPEKTAEETEDEQTAAHTSDEMKALCELREQIKKRDTKEYVDHLENHLNTYGSLFLMQKITFSLASSNDTSTNHFQSNCAFSDQDHSIDNYFIPIMDSELIKKSTETTKQCYSTGQNFLLLLPDGTGQVLYPSGNIGILIVCPKPNQFIFIILEDAEKQPQIQAVFMSNGHATCYHHKGTLWTVLDPWGGSYFDEKGVQKKRWTWWDFSRHVHAPPFQPITLILNSHIEVKMLKQDEIYVLFTKDKETITFNVGSKLQLKDPEGTCKMRWSTGELERYCSSKKLEIFCILNKIRKLVRISATPQDREEMIHGYIHQLQKSLNFINTLTNIHENTPNVLKIKEIQESETAVKKKPHHAKKKKPMHSNNKPKIKLPH